MYRPIVSSAMRKQISTSIVAPLFCNMNLYNDGYRVTVSLHISEEVFAYMQNFCTVREAKPIQYKGRFYLHWEKLFGYKEASFVEAYAEAETALRHMKVLIREAKIHILQDEIDLIKYC